MPDRNEENAIAFDYAGRPNILWSGSSVC